MKFDPDFDALILSAIELDVLGDQYTASRNTLSLLKEKGARSEDVEPILADFKKHAGKERERFISAFETLVNPHCVAELHYTIAEHSITRSYLAWPQCEDMPLAVLSRRADGFALTTRSTAELESLLARVLAVEEGLASANLSLGLPAVTTLVGLALMDAFRFSQLQSWLGHAAPAQRFSTGDVVERLRDAASNDFRWPLLFFDKILPDDVLASIEEEEVVQALRVLEDAGVLLSLADVEAGSDPGFFVFSDAGELIADGLLHAASKVGMRVSRLIADGEVGHEALLVVRDPNYLWLFDVAGQEGVIASLDRQAWKDLSRQIFHPKFDLVDQIQIRADSPAEKDVQEKDEIRSAATVMQSDLEIQVVRCPKCASLVKPGTRFCSTCGASLE